MANKQIIGDVRVYSRHSADCPHKSDTSYMKCQCPKWMQWQQDGKPVQVSAKTRSMEGLKAAAERQTRILRGETLKPNVGKSMTIEQAVKDWLEFRQRNGLGNEKPELMGRKLTEWADANGVLYLHELTGEQISRFRSSLPYRTKTSSSLKVHWSVMCGFFGWATGAKLLSENPVPNTKLFPQFRIKYNKPEVVVPTSKQVNKVLANATGLSRLFLLTMRYSGMAIRDTTILSKSKMTGNLIRGNRSKTQERYRVRIPQWLADALLALPGEYPFWDGVITPRRMVHRWEKRLYRILKAAQMTPHKFRHFFISEQLAAGVSIEDVSKMVGTSPVEIRKTYEHWIKEAEDRLDTVQAEVWIAQGLDEDGNKKPVVN